MIELLIVYLIYLVLILLIYLGILKAVSIIYDKLKKHGKNRLFNPIEYLPEEEIHTLRQVFFLIVIGMSFTIIIYTLIALSIHSFSNYFVFIDILLSLFVCLIIKKETAFEKIVFLSLIPYASTLFSYLDVLMIDPTTKVLINPIMYYITMIFIVFHLIGFLYVIKAYISKFNQYTESNGLGISILLLIGIVFFSFILTPLTEGVDLLDALVMVSNAFTSNGYAVLGNTTLGKINSVILVWGGYILSGVGTATLATALISKHFHRKFEDMNEKFDQLQKSIDALNDEKNE